MWLNGVRRACAAVAAAAMVAVSLMVVSPAIATPGGPGNSAEDASASTADCVTLLSIGYCELDYENYPDPSTLTIPEGIKEITVILSGGSGASVDGGGGGGQGAAIIGSIDMSEAPADRKLTVWLASQGRNMDDQGTGWSDGGQGNSTGKGTGGGAGGGSSGLAWSDDGHDDPLMVAAGGGGGGRYWETHKGSSGGAGGTLEATNDGQDGAGGDTAGSGGEAAGAPGPDGSNGRTAPHNAVGVAGTGGGGGGYSHGGEGGTPGFWTYKEYHPGGGGGGGAGDSFADDRVSVYSYGAAAYGNGSLKIFAGGWDGFGCVDSSEPRHMTVPDGVTSYGFIAIGGAGQDHSGAGAAGSGALVSGVLDVQGVSSLEYWVGCNGAHFDGAGYGVPGDGGGSTFGGSDGRDGGGATMIALSDPFTPLVAAGGGGGGGGNGGDCSVAFPDSGCGGPGGSAGGEDGSRYAYNGVIAGDYSGGRSNSNTENGRSTPNGGKGEHASFGTGGGGGGGAGYPRGGEGGHQDGGDPGGGGGAGGSFFSGRRVTHGSVWASGLTSARGGSWVADGAILLFPFKRSTSSLTVEKVVSGGAGSFATGPFTVGVKCTLAGESVLDDSVSLAPGASHTFDGVAVGSKCAVTETGTGGASTPASPQTVEIGTKPAKVTLTNTFQATSFAVSVSSVLRGEGGGPASGVHVPLGGLGVHVACTLAGRPITLPAPVSGGELSFVGEDTWGSGGTTVRVDGVPVGAKCTAKLAAGSGATSTAYAVDGSGVDGDDVSFTLGAKKTTVAVTDTYQLAPLAVSKAADGDSTPPAGETYSGTVACTFQGRQVTLPDTAVFSMGVGESQRVHNLPVGGTCTVTETDRGTAVATTYSPAQTVPITADPVASVTVTNTFDSGSLLVSVRSSGAGAEWANTPFTVHVSCTLGADTVLDDTFTTPSAAGGWTSYDVDGGASCTAVETVTGSASGLTYSSSSDPTPSRSPVRVTVAANSPSGLSVGNRFDAAPLRVVSTVSGAGAKYASAPVTVTAQACTFNDKPIDITPGEASASFTLPARGGSGSVPVLVTGASCDVVETDTGGATATSYDVVNGDPETPIASGGVRVTVNQPEDETPTSVTIVGRFDLAALSVTTTVAGPAAWAANTSFRTQVQCLFEGVPVSRLGPDGIAVLEFGPDGALVPNHGSEVVKTLSVGSRCHAAESDTGGATTVAYDPDGPGSQSGVVTVPADGAAIGITNTFAATSLATSAVLAGNDAAAHGADDFHFEAVCRFNGRILPAPPDDPNGSEVFALIGGQTHVVSGLPVGADCTVDEFDTRHATQVAPSTVQQITVGPGAAEVTFRNVFEVTALTVNEVLTGSGADTYGSGRTFTAQVTCVWPDESDGLVPLPDGGRVELSAVNGYAATVDAPVGVTCHVGQSRRMATEQTVSPPVTLHAGEHHQLTVTSVYRLSPVTVSKTAYGEFRADQSFGFDATCTWPGPDEPVSIPLSGKAPGDFGLRSGEEHTVQVLRGAQCTVTETDTGGAIRVAIDTQGANVSTRGRATTFTITTAATTIRVTNFLRGSLPVTGSEITGILALAALLFLLAAALLLTRRRRARHRPTP